MSSPEVTTVDVEADMPPPSPPIEVVEARSGASEEPAPAPKRVIKREATKEAPAKVEPGTSVTPEMREVNRGADKAIRDVIESLGGVAFQCHITRKQPDEIEDPDTGKWVTTKGFLKMVEHAIDEEWIQKKYGGGTYEVAFKKPGPKGGYVYAAQTTISIAGDPNLNELRRTAKKSEPAPVAPGSEAPSVVNQALTFMGKAVERAEERAQQRPSHDDGIVALLRDQLAEERRARDKLADEMRSMRAEMLKPPAKTAEESVTSSLLGKLIDGDSARVNAVRAQAESEVRALNEARREDEKRAHERMDREIAQLRVTHERELSTLRSSQEVALQAVRSSTEVQVSAARSSYETQMTLTKADLERLRSENAELRTELRELRAKKDKTPLEMIKDMAAIKDAFGLDEDDTPKGIVAQIGEAVANPGFLEGIGSFIGKARAPDPAVAAATAAAEARGKRRVVKVNGKKMLMVMEADGRTFTEIEPPKPAAVPGEPVMPEVDPAVIAQMVQLMESAFEGGQEPAIVAQGARSRVPEALLLAIRDHGVDAVMSKMAKLSSTSPLSSQRGRVWVRQLGEALVG